MHLLAYTIEVTYNYKGERKADSVQLGDLKFISEFLLFQIIGNQNGYQASTTIVDLYNVRHIKIQSNEKRYCLRIELCGKSKLCFLSLFE
jgi:hypothetical protein